MPTFLSPSHLSCSQNSGVKATDKGWGDDSIVDATYLYLQYSKGGDKIPGASWLVRPAILVSFELY